VRARFDRGSQPFGAPLAYGIIASVRMPFEPMLATNRISRPLEGEWVLEPKFDGWRAIVAVDQDVRVWTRTGHELTARLPELAPLVECCGGASVVLDGELVAGQGRGADFYGLLPRVAARRRNEPLTSCSTCSRSTARSSTSPTAGDGRRSTGLRCVGRRGAPSRDCTALSPIR